MASLTFPQPELDITAPLVSEGYPHGHVPSAKSKELQRDTFFFAPMGPHPSRLVLALNQKLTPVSSVKLQRWAHLISGREAEGFFICPVAVKRIGIMSYSVSPSGPIVEPASIEPLPAGNYGWYLDRELTDTGFVDLTGVDPAMRNRSFEYNVTFMKAQRLWDLYTFPSDVEQVVITRDLQRCRVTRSTTNVMPTWIVPPPWAWAAVDAGNPENLDPAPFIVAANAFVLQKDLRVHFYNHNFAVDADDEYRIVVLRDMGEEWALLPTHLPRRPEHDDADVEFFRLHLRYSLNFMVLGGDISETYPPGRILSSMEELGVSGQDAEMVPLSDPRWHSELAQAILVDELEARTNFNLDETDDSDSEYNPEPTVSDSWARFGFSEHLPEASDGLISVSGSTVLDVTWVDNPWGRDCFVKA